MIKKQMKKEGIFSKNMAIFVKQQKTFRQTSTFSNVVDKVINIIPIVSLTFLPFINNLITSYPPIIVNNW